MIETKQVTLGDETHRIDIRPDKFEVPLFQQIFGQQVYSLARLQRSPQLNSFYDHALRMGWTPLIIDLGANIGLSAAYFSMVFPKAQVLAVEPEAANFALLQANTRERPLIKAYHRAASCRHEAMEISNPETEPVGFRMRAAEGGGIASITVPDMLAEFPASKRYLPFLIKIDIEGYEATLFESNFDWIDQFPVLITELHDWALATQGTSKNFLKAIAGRDRDFIHIGDNVFSIAQKLAIPL